MYLFTRRAQLGHGQPTDAMTWVTSITEKVNQIVEFEVHAWTPVFSENVGEIAWTAFLPELAELESGDFKLMSDALYLDLVGQGARYLSTQPINDQLLQLIHGTPDPARDIHYVTVAQATVAPGQLRHAMELGIEIAVQAERITGLPTHFYADTTGNWGGVHWITGYEGVELMQHSNEKINSTMPFVEMIDAKASKAFASGTQNARQACYRRVI